MGWDENPRSLTPFYVCLKLELIWAFSNFFGLGIFICPTQKINYHRISMINYSKELWYTQTWYIFVNVLLSFFFMRKKFLLFNVKLN